MATSKQIHWMGEAALTLLLAGMLYLVIRMIDGRSYHPTIAMPTLVRIGGVLLFVALSATIRTQRHYRKLGKRQPTP